MIARKSVNMLKNMIFSVILSVGVFFIRCLPIYFGIHVIINMILTIIMSYIIGISIVKSTYSTLLAYLILSLGEVLNVVLLNLLNININLKVENPFVKCLYGIPSLVFVLIFILTATFILKKIFGGKEDLNNVIG